MALSAKIAILLAASGLLAPAAPLVSLTTLIELPILFFPEIAFFLAARAIGDRIHEYVHRRASGLF